eukprot:RCo052574
MSRGRFGGGGGSSTSDVPLHTWQFPEDAVSPSKRVELTLNNTKMVAQFGDLFMPSTEGGPRVIPMIPHYTDGVLYRLFQRKNTEIYPLYDMYVYGTRPDPTPEASGEDEGAPPAAPAHPVEHVPHFIGSGHIGGDDPAAPPSDVHEPAPPPPPPPATCTNGFCPEDVNASIPTGLSAEVLAANATKLATAKREAQNFPVVIGTMLVRTVIPGIPVALLFSYADKDMQKWGRIFEDAAIYGRQGKSDILACPPIGTNNMVTFWQSALAIFFGLRSVLMDEVNPAHVFSEIRVLTIFQARNVMSSSRVILHLQHMMDINERENFCLVCLNRKIDTLLHCGHRIMCNQCATQVARTTPLCPVCRHPFNERKMVLAVKVVDCSVDPEFKCCEVNGDKLRKINVPCG